MRLTLKRSKRWSREGFGVKTGAASAAKASMINAERNKKIFMFTTRVKELDCLIILGNESDITLSPLAVHFIIVFSGKTNGDEMKYAGVTLLIQLGIGEPHFCRCDTLS